MNPTVVSVWSEICADCVSTLRVQPRSCTCARVSIRRDMRRYLWQEKVEVSFVPYADQTHTAVSSARFADGERPQLVTAGGGDRLSRLPVVLRPGVLAVLSFPGAPSRATSRGGGRSACGQRGTASRQPITLGFALYDSVLLRLGCCCQRAELCRRHTAWPSPSSPWVTGGLLVAYFLPLASSLYGISRSRRNRWTTWPSPVRGAHVRYLLVICGFPEHLMLASPPSG